MTKCTKNAMREACLILYASKKNDKKMCPKSQQKPRYIIKAAAVATFAINVIFQKQCAGGLRLRKKKHLAPASNVMSCLKPKWHFEPLFFLLWRALSVIRYTPSDRAPPREEDLR